MKQYAYIIMKEAVYGHGCHGVFLNKESAIESCKICAEQDYDNYHEFIVHEIVIGDLPSQDEIQTDGFDNEVFRQTGGPR